jgi:double-stranded uracil-DNA glycosylase
MIHIRQPLPDITAENLKVLFVGFNPGIESARAGHHYANRSNRFWRLLFESDLTPYRLKPEEDYKLPEFGFGSTNIVSRESKSASEITKSEYMEGSAILRQLIISLMPLFVCYVGYGVYKAFASGMLQIPENRITVVPGLQSSMLISGVKDYICSSSSGLNTIPYDTQLECFKELKKLIER